MPNYRRARRDMAVRCPRPDGSTKAAFRSPAKAKQAIRAHRHASGVQLYVYECPRCGYFHITSQPRKGEGS